MAQTSTQAVREAEPAEGSIKETIESILVAFILAFIFRAFVVEAFVIPTGSMAPTLFGAHMRLTCPDCGYTFDVNYSGDRSDGDEPIVPASAPLNRDYHCPNCGYLLPHKAEQQVRFGDRILVLKYLYLFEPPRRWDVVVFKSPYEESHRHDRNDAEYSQNYIKRLIGTPLESVVILDGDIYVGPRDATRDTPEAFKIQRKPDYAQAALWRTVYDNDYIPAAHLDRTGGGSPFKQPWTAEAPGQGWDVGTPERLTRAFRFDNANGAAAALSFDPEANQDSHALTDYLPYDEQEQLNRRWDAHPVSDLRLAAFYRRTAGDGPLQFQLTKNDDCFTARFSPQGVELWRAKVRGTAPLALDPGQRVCGPVAVPELGGSAPVQVEMTNVDYQVTVRVNGRVIPGMQYPYEAPVQQLFQQAAGDEGRLATKPTVRITAERQTCMLEHVMLSRDIYYLNRLGNSHFYGSPDNIIHLGPQEYFVLGDNSFISGDARYWTDDVDLRLGEDLYAEAGRVPGRFMLGKAFYVYWPAGFRPGSIPLGITPDFAEMRFIH